MPRRTIFQIETGVCRAGHPWIEGRNGCLQCHNKRVRKHRQKPEAREREHKYGQDSKVRKRKCENEQKRNKLPEVREHNRKRRRERLQNDIQFKLAGNLRIRLNKAIRNNQKAGSAVKDLGIGISEFKLYLENQFEEGMTWDNYGLGVDKWNIDHVIPLSSFDLTDRT